jgi:5'-nucleotidase
VKRLIAIDVDEVCADLLTAWVARYNRVYGDTLDPKSIRGWDLKPYFKKCAEYQMYALLDADIYKDVRPHPGACDIVGALRARGDILFVTSCSKGTMDAKYAWLRRHKFITNMGEFCAIRNKGRVRADILLDDAEHNVQAFRNAGGLAILVAAGHNQASTDRSRIPFRDTPAAVDLCFSLLA